MGGRGKRGEGYRERCEGVYYIYWVYSVLHCS